MERDETYWLRGTVETLEATVEGLEYELRVRDIQLKQKDRRIAELEQQLQELKQQALAGTKPAAARPVPAFVKLNLPPRRRRRKPGRKIGHEAALRKKPRKIDHHQDVPLPKDRKKQKVCPHCKCCLTRRRRHQRIVEDLVASAVEVTCYNTQSGYCPHCRKRIESRAPEQPPAANLPHGQLVSDM